MNIDIETLETNLKSLDEKLSHLERTDKPDRVNHSEFIEDLLAQFQVSLNISLL